MSLKTTEANAALLNHVLNNIAWANIGDAGGLPAGTAGSLYAALCTADPGVGGDQTSSEISYTGYARVALARDNTWWTVATSSATNAKAITFGAMTAGAGGTATFICIGTASSGAGHLLFRCPVTTPGAGLAISNGITPSIAIGQATITEA